MKPDNSNKNNDCTPISSNCVIWQGPCLACINVNTGDTVSDVVFNLATELCELKDQLDLSDLELGCLIDCPFCPEPYKSLENILTLIIERLCLVAPNSDPEEIIVNLAPCFQYTDINGEFITQLPVYNYVKLIGIKVCELQITVNQHTSILANHETKITTLESADHIVLPKITPNYVITPVVTANMDVVLEALEDQFCQLKTITGVSSALSHGCTTPVLTLAPTISSNTAGRAGIVTNSVYTNSSYADASWKSSLAYSRSTGAPNVDGSLPYTGATKNEDLGFFSLKTNQTIAIGSRLNTYNTGDNCTARLNTPRTTSTSTGKKETVIIPGFSYECI